MQYKLITNTNDIFRLNDDGSISCIPNCETNRDWQEYQEWLAVVDENGDPVNEPLPADEE